MSDVLNKAPERYQKERQNFLTRLRKFNQSRGISFSSVPYVGKTEIDLYLLYWLVTVNGGVDKVNARNLWDDLLQAFNIPDSTVNGSILLKHTYLRCLEPFERAYFTCDDDDDVFESYDDDSSSRFRRSAGRMSASIGRTPTLSGAQSSSSVHLTYNHQQHIVKPGDRASLNLACNLHQPTDYDKLVLSLISPLPNEHDFAINICTLLSNEGRRTLRFAKCPRLLNAILAHAGIFDHESQENHLGQVYRVVRSYDFAKFWQKSSKADQMTVDFMLPSGFNEDIMISKETSLSTAVDDVDDSDNNYFADIAHFDDSVNSEMCGQRILQVATIIRNLSFDADNAAVMALNEQCVRFAILCSVSEWNQLTEMGFDMLSNVCAYFTLDSAFDPASSARSEISTDSPALPPVPVDSNRLLSETLLTLLERNICSPDRFKILSSVDLLTKLCSVESNAKFINELISKETFFAPLLSYLTLNDVHLIVCTLECLYALTTVGQIVCHHLAQAVGAIDLLISLITVEAQSYGPGACILMRVVETVPTATQNSASQPSDQPQQLVQQQQQPLPPQQQQKSQFPNIPDLSGQRMVPNIGPVSISQPSRLVLLPQQPVAPKPGEQMPHMSQLPGPRVLLQPRQDVVNNTEMTNNVRPQMPVKALGQAPFHPLIQAAPHASQQQQQQQVQLRISNGETNRAFCVTWLQATYEHAPPAVVVLPSTSTSCQLPQQQVQQFSIHHDIMYKQYLASLHKLGHQEVVSAQQYAACVRSVFGPGVGPNRRPTQANVNGTFMFDVFYDNIRVRAQPLSLQMDATVFATGAATAPIATTHSASINSASVSVQSLMNGQANSHPLKNQISSGAPSVVPPMSGKLPPPNGQIQPASGGPILTSLLHPSNNGHVNGVNHREATNGGPKPAQLCNGSPTKKAEVNVAESQPSTMNGNADLPKVAAAAARLNGYDGACQTSSESSPPPSKCIRLEERPSKLDDAVPSGPVQPSNIGQPQAPLLNGHANQTSPGPTDTVSHRTPTQDSATDVSQSRPSLEPSDKSSSAPPHSSVDVVQPSNSTGTVPSDSPYLCEWQNCAQSFKSPSQAECHAISAHCQEGQTVAVSGSGDEAKGAHTQTYFPCLWAGCDPNMMRTKFSLMTHIQDKHCHPQLMRMMAIRRVQLASQGRTDLPVPTASTTHPGYAANAALAAVKRHTAQFAPAKAHIWSDDREGPVTKSLRLTAALILRNLVANSASARQRVKSYESHLSNVSLSNVESSRTLAHVLYDMTASPPL